MRVERFKATSMRDALTQIRRRLGEDAVILHSRESDEGIEVIAALDRPLKGQQNLLDIDPGPQEEKKEETKMDAITHTQEEIEAAPPMEKMPHEDADKAVFTTPSIEPEKEHTNGHMDWDQLMSFLSQKKNGKHKAGEAMKEVTQKAVDFSRALKVEIEEIERQRKFWIESEKRLESLKKELTELKHYILTQELAEVRERARLLKERRRLHQKKEASFDQQKLKAKLFSGVKKRLEERGLSKGLADKITNRFHQWLLRSEIDLENPMDFKKIQKGLIYELKNAIKVRKQEPNFKKEQETIALIGPPHAGKTTTALKLVMNNFLLMKKKVAFIQVSDVIDESTQQSAMLASIAKFSFSIVSDPKDLMETIAHHRDKDLILIDFDFHNSRDFFLVRQFIEKVKPTETHLVLPTTESLEELNKHIQVFDEIDFDYMIFTQLDRQKKIGHILEINQKTGKPISYLCNGSMVPDDIEPADPLKLAHMILKGA